MSEKPIPLKAPAASGITTLWSWRDFNRRSRFHEFDTAAEQFRDRAAELAEQVEQLLSGGLTIGAEAAIATLAEEDMTDFCILVDLADEVTIPGVAPLSDDVRQHLQTFLAVEPWRSLVADNDITVCFAMLEEQGATDEDTPWYQSHPEIVGVCASTLELVNEEQLMRFVGEVNSLSERHEISISPEMADIIRFSVRKAAERLGVRKISFLGSA